MINCITVCVQIELNLCAQFLFYIDCISSFKHFGFAIYHLLRSFRRSFTFLEANQHEYHENQTPSNPQRTDSNMHDNHMKDERSEN